MLLQFSLQCNFFVKALCSSGLWRWRGKLCSIQFNMNSVLVTQRQNVLICFSAFFCRQCCVCFLCSHCSCTGRLVIMSVMWWWAVMPVPSQRKVKNSAFVGDGARAAHPFPAGPSVFSVSSTRVGWWQGGRARAHRAALGDTGCCWQHFTTELLLLPGRAGQEPLHPTLQLV